MGWDAIRQPRGPTRAWAMALGDGHGVRYLTFSPSLCVQRAKWHHGAERPIHTNECSEWISDQPKRSKMSTKGRPALALIAGLAAAAPVALWLLARRRPKRRDAIVDAYKQNIQALVARLRNLIAADISLRVIGASVELDPKVRVFSPAPDAIAATRPNYMGIVNSGDPTASAALPRSRSPARGSRRSTRRSSRRRSRSPSAAWRGRRRPSCAGRLATRRGSAETAQASAA